MSVDVLHSPSPKCHISLKCSGCRSSDSDSESEPEMPDNQPKLRKPKKSKSKKKKDKKQVKSSSSIAFDRANQEKKSASLTLSSKHLIRQRTLFGNQDTNAASHSSSQSAVRLGGLLF